MYEIFSDRRREDLQRSNHQRHNIAVKGGSILKSKSNNVLKKKKIFADLGNIMKQKHEDESLIIDDQILKQSTSDKKNSSIDNASSKDRHQRSLEKIVDDENSFPGMSHEVPDDHRDTPSLCSENTVFDESSNSTLGENARIEEDVFFGTYYSISDDEQELMSTANWDLNIPESMSGYCSGEGSCDETSDDRWLEKPLWKSSEPHQIVGVPETSMCETMIKLEDMEFTSLFSEMSCAVKATLDVPDLLFSSDYENDVAKIPVPDLEW